VEYGSGRWELGGCGLNKRAATQHRLQQTKTPDTALAGAGAAPVVFAAEDSCKASLENVVTP
jgi:hypothetical protein